MPEPTHPPYAAGSVVIPRQLQRWLDVNPQNGSLTRTRKYLLIPSFEITNIVWRGFSEIVAEFHVSSPNNFSLQSFEIPSSPSYTLCVAYVDDNFVTHRYRLWSSENEVIYFDIPQYEGQRINKNFKIEVWSTPVLLIAQDTSIRIDTSVLGEVDYRYGDDEQLVTFTNPCTGQQVPIDPNVNAWYLPLVFNVCGVVGPINVALGTELSGGAIALE